mmetsp:Transcript_37949/g.33978  ORF Transcript_37949/g.33978 Transcript_37949/m.33978 type:complete len:82 (-) Transcript_37949:315-560(-)
MESGWTPEKDQVLHNLALQFKLEWKKIIKAFKTRTGQYITATFAKSRYRLIVKYSSNGSQKRHYFSDKEDIELVRLVKSVG